MRAVVLRRGQLVVDEVPEPEPGPGQVLVEVVACGICGSDLHCRHHAASFVASARRAGLSLFDFDPDRDLVMGHEFTGRVVARGPGADPDRAGPEPGTLVVAHPSVRVDGRFHAVGYSNDYPGAYADRVVVDGRGALPLPAGTDPEHAALTEPLAVGLHAVNQSRAAEQGSAVVVGCGPVGLATITALRLRGVPLVVAADFSPARRDLAARVGAHVVVDPRQQPAVDAWREAGGRGPTVLFEAVGVPGLIDAAMQAAPPRSEVVVVGLCMQPDRIEPTLGISKQLTLRFVLGWTAQEFRECLEGIATGRVDVAPLVTGRVGLDDTAAAFDELAHPDQHAKILVRPGD
jgi:2-desacetyl-2-hydroxyethyl bacteriochlorophyllide A dehydrogenase